MFCNCQLTISFNLFLSQLIHVICLIYSNTSIEPDQSIMSIKHCLRVNLTLILQTENNQQLLTKF